MTKDEYLALKAKYVVERHFDTRVAIARQLDQHVKDYTVAACRTWAVENLGKNDGEFLTMMVRVNLGSAEVDEFCSRHKFYPDYM